MSKIEWTEKTWNPVIGCSKISPGCDNCYAERMAGRQAGMELARLKKNTDGYEESCGFDLENGKYINVVNKAGKWNGHIYSNENALEIPLKRKKPTMYFVVSMGDLFHESVPFDFIDKIFAVMALCPQHTFQILTKRPGRMAEYFRYIHKNFLDVSLAASRLPRIFNDIDMICDAEYDRLSNGRVLPNVWLGVTAENREQADLRIPILLQIPAAVRFVSVEPMLGAVDLTSIKWAKIDTSNWQLPPGVPKPEECWSMNNVLEARPADELNPPKIGLDWVIVGGESGPGARPMHYEWPKAIRDQCVAAGVPFFFKQWGEWGGVTRSVKDRRRHVNDPNWHLWPDTGMESAVSIKVGKKKAGRLLDGRTWEQYPEIDKR